MGHLSFFALFYFLVALVLIVIYVLFVFLFFFVFVFLVVQTAEEEAVLVVRSVNDDQVEVVAAIAA